LLRGGVGALWTGVVGSGWAQQLLQVGNDRVGAGAAELLG
jgi:hypothetical protein